VAQEAPSQAPLIQAPLISLLCERVRPGAYIHVATDWQEYAEQILAVMAAEPKLVNTAADFAPRPEYRPQTKFESRGLKLGPRRVGCDLSPGRIAPDVPAAAPLNRRSGRFRQSAARSVQRRQGSHASLERLLSMPDEKRQTLVHNWVTDLIVAGAPQDFVQAIACLADDAVAEKAYEVIFQCKRGGNP
jgi:hypothetical protein